MTFIEHFYRSTPDAPFQQFTLPHLVYAIIFIMFAGFILTRSKERLDRLFPFIWIVLLFDTINRYGFYFITGYNGLKESLPIYHCRIIAVFGLIYPKFKNQKIATIITYWGILGSIASVVWPIPDIFYFPHILTMLFFVYHPCLFALGIYMLDEWPTMASFKWVASVTAIFNVVLYIINNILHSNYGMVNIPPMLRDTLPHNNITYLIIAIVAYTILLGLVHLLLKPLRAIRQRYR